MPRGVFFGIDDELNRQFHEEVARRLGRPLRRGDILQAGEEAILIWLTSS